MSGKKGITVVETVIIGSLIIVVLFIVLWYFGRELTGEFSAGSSGMTGQGAAATSIQQAPEGGRGETVRTGNKFGEAGLKRFSPSFKGRGNIDEPQRLGASSVIDDSPVPPDGGGMPSQELPSIKSGKRTGVCAPPDVNYDF